MRQRFKAGGKRVGAGARKTATRKTATRKTATRKIATRKRRSASKIVRLRDSSARARDPKYVRLDRELSEAAEQQRATSEVLRLIGGLSGDLQPVFASILASVVRLCAADNGAINRWDGQALRLVATHNMPPAYIDLRTHAPARPFENSVSSRLLTVRAPLHIANLAEDQAYLDGDPPTVAAVESAGVRATLAVPMFKDKELIGSFTVGRKEVRPFTDRQIEIVQNFAQQAVMAIENARLLTELRQRTNQLGRSVAELRRERNNKLMNMEAMTASISHEVRQPLASIAANGSAALRFLGHNPPNHEEVRAALNRMVNDSHRASQVFDSIRTLFGKGDGGHEPVDLNELVRGVLDSLHGELEDHGITSGVELSADVPPVMGHKGQLQEVLINLVNNAIEAMQADANGRRALRVRTARQGESKVLVAVEDSGPGIDPAQVDNIFDAFVTTKPEGTGLGLALCRMIVERHAGKLSASPAQPRGSIFQVVLPIGHRPAEMRQ
jgi:signal transduction histidine kinase